MYEMTSYCGLDCAVCPAYIATQKDDTEGLAKVARDWSEQFGMEIPPEAVVCDACKSETGRLCGYCSMCTVRSCATGREAITCAHCDDYGCDTLLNCPAYDAGGRENLEKIRSEL